MTKGDNISSSGSESKVSACNAGDPGSIPQLGRFPGEGNGNPLEYSFLENPMDSGGWRATVHGVSVSQTGLSDLAAHTHGLLQTGKPMKGEPQRP